MPSVQVKNVPPDVHRTLRRRAAAAGQSLQEYLLQRLVDDAAAEPLDAFLERVGRDRGGRLTFGDAAAAVRAERGDR